jgi:hypothetical protein
VAFQAGYDKGVTFDLDPAGSPATLQVTGWTVEDGGDVLETTHTGSGGNDAYIAGISRVPGNVTANVDAAALPNAASPGVVFGAKGTLTCAVGGSTPWSIHIMISKVHWASTVNGLVTYNFDYVSDSTSGSRTRPT